MHRTVTTRNTRRQRGFSLIEVLIAMLVLAIGLLGMAQMQASGIRSTHGAYLRTQATILADDMLDSMRANLTAVGAGGYDRNFGGAPPAGGTTAGDDTIAWLNNLAATLPGGDGQISRAGSDITVSISWTGLRQSETAGVGQAKIFSVDTTL